LCPGNVYCWQILTIAALADKWDVTYSHFWLLLLLKVTRSGANGTGTLVDIITLKVVSGTKEGYGNQRLWTAVAWGVGSW